MDREEIEKVARGLSETQAKWVCATPAEVADDAGLIHYRAGFMDAGVKFAGFAKRVPEMIERRKSYDGSKWNYTLTPLGQQVKAYLQEQQP